MKIALKTYITIASVIFLYQMVDLAEKLYKKHPDISFRGNFPEQMSVKFIVIAFIYTSILWPKYIVILA